MGELGREIDAGIEELLAQYAEFIKAGNPNLAASVLALNDPRFGQYEEYEPRLLDASATKVHLRHLIAERPLRVCIRDFPEPIDAQPRPDPPAGHLTRPMRAFPSPKDHV